MNKIHVNEYFTDFFQMSIMGAYFLFLTTNYELGKNLYILITNKTYDNHYNYQYVISYQDVQNAQMHENSIFSDDKDSDESEQESEKNNEIDMLKK